MVTYVRNELLEFSIKSRLSIRLQYFVLADVHLTEGDVCMGLQFPLEIPLSLLQEYAKLMVR